MLKADSLDITAVSRAYIMEPQWNSTVEEQALARIHRMGQTKEVTTVRYVMEGTFEEVSYPCVQSVELTSSQRVVDIQERKKDMAGLLLSPGQHQPDSDDSLDKLRVGFGCL
jgi:SWI/SNF-related matrix-associated actin-dependent regulator of chromatin subfamily A3